MNKTTAKPTSIIHEIHVPKEISDAIDSLQNRGQEKIEDFNALETFENLYRQYKLPQRYCFLNPEAKRKIKYDGALKQMEEIIDDVRDI